MTLLGIVCVMFFSGLVLSAPRPWGPLGLVAGICYLTQAQSLEILGLNFFAVRLVILAGIGRALIHACQSGLRLNRIDYTVLLYAIATTIIYSYRESTIGAFVFQLGKSFDILGSYIIFKSFVRDEAEIEKFVSMIALLIVPLSLFMAAEALTGKNIFSSFGGVPETSDLRYGHFRCQGPFRSPITAGTFGATLVPMLLGLACNQKFRIIASVGLAASICITVTSRSSGPALALMAGLFAWLMWPLRQHLALIRKSGALGLVLLHLAMNAPVWYIFARISDIIGGGGWHRAYLIDQAVSNFFSWWLLGTKDTADWMPTQLEFGGADLTNEFIAAGVAGGITSMGLLIYLVTTCFSALGRSILWCPIKNELFLWGIGAALFAHAVNFFSVQYFDQVHFAWVMLIAIVSSTSDITQTETALECDDHSFKVDQSKAFIV